MESSSIIRLSIALGVFFIMIGWEFLSPRRTQTLTRTQRWPINIGLAIFNMAVMRLSIGSLAFLGAIHASHLSFGLLHQFSSPHWLTLLISLLLLDLAIYCQHVISHKWSLLWQLHQIHHTDLEIDATTAIRFHPLEIFISMLYKIGIIYLIGADPMAVVLFEIILNGTATFNHSNINLPKPMDKILRWVLITPDIHRIHHSTVRTETDSNYGFSLSLWDRLFKTYIDTPEQAQTQFSIGLPNYRNLQELGFIQLLLLPFQPQGTDKNKTDKT